MRRLLLIGLLAAGCSPPADQVVEFNYLNSALRDLDNPTPLNATVLHTECADYQTKAEAYRKIRVWGIGKKVDRYVAGCAKLQ